MNSHAPMPNRNIKSTSQGILFISVEKGRFGTTATMISIDTTVPHEPNYLLLAVMLGMNLAFTIVACVVSRRRER